MDKVINFFDYLFSLFNNKPLEEKEGYYLYIRIYFKNGNKTDFLSYPISIAESGLREGLIKKIRSLTNKERKDAINKVYKK